jgi:cytochrome P450
VLTDPDLVPFEPPPRPLGLRGLPTLWRNYVESIPRAAYEQGVTRITNRMSDVVLLCEPDLIGEILVEKADAFHRDPATRRAFAPVIGDSSLFLAEGAEWRWQRRAVAPIFRHETLLSFVPIFAEMALRQLQRWRVAGPDQAVDAAADMTRTTFEIIVDAMLGGTASLDPDRFAKALTDNFETIPWHLVYVVLSLPKWLPYPHRGRAMRSRDFLHHEIGRLVAARRRKPSAQPDLLELLVAAEDPETGRRMTDAEIANNLLTFISAGHETTAVALTWTLWLLAKDQDVQQRVFDEVRAVAGERPLPITAAQCEGLVFCRQVISEAMRLFPPAASIGRQPKAAMELRGMTLTPRTRIHIPVFALHRNVRLWDNPNAFDPDRFAADRSKGRSRYAFLPFGGGQRVCIGASFAMLEAAVILATLIRAYRVRPVPGHRPKPVARVTLRPARGMPLLLDRR